MKLKIFLIACAILTSLSIKAQDKETLSIHLNGSDSPTQIAISGISKITFEKDGLNIITNDNNEPHFFNFSEVSKITFDAKCVGVEDIYDNKSLDIYPNPVASQLFIKAETEIEEIAIYDVYGRQTTVYGLQSTDFVQSIDVANLKSGIYFIKVKTNDNEIVKRFIKK